MSNNNSSEKDVTLYKDETTNSPSPGEEVKRRRPTLLGRIEETIGATSPLSLPPEIANATDGEANRDEITFGMESPTSVLDETDHKKDLNYLSSRSRNSPSSYFAPTRSSQAKKHDKIEPFGRQGSPLLRTSSMHNTRPMSPLARSNSTLRNYRNNSTESGQLSHSVSEQRDEAHKMRSSTFNPTDSPKFHENNVTEILGGWSQGRDVDLGESRVAGFEHLEEEAMRERREELEIAKEEVVSLRQRNYELVAENGNLKAFSMEHDKAVEDKLKFYKAELEMWKQNYDALSTKCRKLEDQVKAETSQKEATETENKKLRATVVEKQNDIAKMKTELKKKDNELIDMTQHAANTEEEALESNKKLTRLQKSVCDMGRVIVRWIQLSFGGVAIDLKDLDQVIRNCADDAETNEVLLHVRQFVKMFVEKNGSLERQLEDKKYEITNIKKAIEEQSHEEVPPTPGLMPYINPLYSSDKIETLYKEERAKRIAAEQKLSALVTEDKQDSQLQKTQQDLHSQLADLQAQITHFTQQAQTSQHEAAEWKSELTLKQSELDVRTSEFDSALHEKDQEILSYISAYHAFTSDASFRAPAALHSKLCSLERDYASLKSTFNHTSAADAKKRDTITRLERKLKLATAYTTDMQQAMYARAKLPQPSDYARMDDEEFDWESELDGGDDGLKMQPPRFTARPRKVPRYLMEPAVGRRREAVQAYREELRVKREKEVLGLVEVGEAKGKGRGKGKGGGEVEKGGGGGGGGGGKGKEGGGGRLRKGIV
ncbi:hypothetical protein PSV09DRAFT_2382390 [Bipolaris maydis]|nr:hypothetical protein PSV09DRAFT_2382390 [Bipolaris maydis]